MKRLAPYGDPHINPYSRNEQIPDPKLPHELRDPKYSDERMVRPSSNDIRWQASHNGYQMSNTMSSRPLREGNYHSFSVLTINEQLDFCVLRRAIIVFLR